MFRFTTLPPLSLYVHFPWCVRKCPYCDFNSHELRDELPEAQYIEALIADLDQELPDVWGRPLISVFLGGGTPSLFSAASLDRLLAAVRARLPLLPGAEITLEANPGTVEQGRFAEYRAAGVNRLSIGVQSFSDDKLRRLGRIHSGREALRAAESARAAGFEDFNLDLMFALPGQSLAEAVQDLATALTLQPSHISHYQLTIEPNTRFFHAPPALPDEDLAWEMQQRCQEALAESGYTRYEVSAYARPGRQSRHNVNYWQFGDYLGIGAGAHAKITDARQQRIVRTSKLRHPRTFLRHASSAARVDTRRVLTPGDAALEFMMNALRLSAGVPQELFQQHTGLPLSAVSEALQDARARGWLEPDGDRLRASSTGLRYLNDLLALFLPEAA